MEDIEFLTKTFFMRVTTAFILLMTDDIIENIINH